MSRLPLWNDSEWINSIVLHESTQHCWLHFHHPVEILTATTVAEVMPLLQSLQQRVEQQQLYAAGFVSYEAAPAFDASFSVQDFSVQDFSVQTACAFPLAWFGLYAPPQVVTLPEDYSTQVSLDWIPSITQAQYQKAIATIKQYIAQGDTYQVNFSFRLQSLLSSFSPFQPWSYFLQLMQAQTGLYGAFVDLPEWAIASASPELFFRWQNGTVTCRPMKGTAARGLSVEGDRQQAKVLYHSEKNRAENLMIVDMIRNDLGRIAQVGSVQVPHLFEVEQYPTLWQMTSPVQCQTSANFAEIFSALFPCASITGAPKTRTMQIITELEDSPRRIYTGAIGFLTPERTAQFNVAIRTVLVDKVHQMAEYGVGGGIVWDSEQRDEYAECCTKAAILTRQQPKFDLLDSLLWQPATGYFLLDLHLHRLQESAVYFGFTNGLTKAWIERVGDRLQSFSSTLATVDHKVRLRVSRTGEITLEAAPLQVRAGGMSVAIAPHPIHSNNPFLYHKTTHRSVYDQMKQACPGFDDVLLWNERGEITETCIANVVIERDRIWYTPPVSCGLLAGTMRQWLLQQGKLQERVIRLEELLEDLSKNASIYLINSVRQIQLGVITTTKSI